MSKFTVDSFIVELGFNESVIKGLQRVEKLAMQSAQRIEKNLNKGFRINTKQLDSNLTSSLGQLERKFNKTFNKLEERAKNTKAFQFTSQVNDALKQPRQPRRNTGDRAVRAAYQANMSKLKNFDPVLQKYIKSQFYGLAGKAGQMDNSKFNEKLAQLNASVREAIIKSKGVMSTSINGNKAASSLDSLSSAAVKTAGAFISMQAVIESYRKIMEVGLQRASSERAIDFVFGENAEQVKQFTKNLSQTTGTDLAETQSQFAGFGASAKESLGLENSEKLFEAVTIYGRLMGRSNEEIKRALIGFQQVASKGQVMSEEVKGQIAEALPGIVQEMTKAMGFKSEKQFFEAMKKGLSSTPFLLKLTPQLQSVIKAAGGVEKLKDSSQVQVDNLSNAWKDTLNNIFKGSEGGLKDFTRSLTSLLNSLGGTGKTLGESLGSLMTSMSHGVDSMTDISYKVRAFFDEVTLAYRGLTDEQKKVVDALGSGLINSLKVLAGVIAVNKVIGVTRSIYGLMTAITRLGQVADTTADNVNKKNGKPSRFNLGNVLLAGSAVYAGYERLASTPERMEAQAKLPELAKESGLKPAFTMDDVKGWFNSAATKIANFQEPMNNFVNNTESSTPAITGDIVNSNAQLAMAVSELGRKVDALTAETKKPIPVNITGEATIKPDEPAFFRFTQSANDQFTADMLLSSSYPEE
ncbi:tape measure protein [Escherichia coli]|uniref:tape measure protein n=1 Tax=Escherichia coli TaxID=562 RepID=UPI0005716275|nr:tape measure protein [Escherichia coli]EFL2424203.1 tape measure protein [Escherichia coli]MDO2569236.1 tape measure protein [Escherichia coli]